MVSNKGINRNVPLLGDAAHKLEFTVEGLYKSGSNEARLILKVHNLMDELRTYKNAYQLAANTTFSPVLDNATRWNSKYYMLLRFMDLVEIFRGGHCLRVSVVAC